MNLRMRSHEDGALARPQFPGVVPRQHRLILLVGEANLYLLIHAQLKRFSYKYMYKCFSLALVVCLKRPQ